MMTAMSEITIQIISFKIPISMKYLFYFFLTFLFFAHLSCELEDPLADLECDKIITINSTPANGPIADGKSIIFFTATLAEEVKSNSMVTFRTDYGFFVGSGEMKEFAVTSSGKKAIAQLMVSTEVEDFEVSAQLETSCQQFITLSTTPSLPDFIEFQTDRTMITANRSEQAMLTVGLFRNTGRGSISEGVRVNFSQSSNNVNVKADLPEFAFSTNGSVMVAMRSATDSTGVVTLTASVEGAEGSVISKSLDIEFID